MSNQNASCQDTDDRLTYEECRQHCLNYCNSLRAMAEGYTLDDEFAEYDRDHLQQLYPLTQQKRIGPQRFTEEDVNFILSAIIACGNNIIVDPQFPGKLQALINKIYNKGIKEIWEWCIKPKPGTHPKLHDYLYGCYSGDPNDPDALRHRHSHQFCISNESFAKAERLLAEKLDEWLNESKSFEELYTRFREAEKETIGGLGPLSVYDTCLRIACSKNPELLPTKIYFHAGVQWGGEALYHLSRLAKLNWYTGSKDPKEESPDTPVPSELFNGFLTDLTDDKERIHNLENLLCAFHEPFFLLETVVRVKKGKKLRKTREDIYKNAQRALERAKAEAKSKGKVLKKTDYMDYIRPQDKRYLKLLDLLGYRYK